VGISFSLAIKFTQVAQAYLRHPAQIIATNTSHDLSRNEMASPALWQRKPFACNRKPSSEALFRRDEPVMRGLRDEVEAIEVHHLVPRRGEIMHELLLGIRTSIDLGQSPELGV
jgi:hypothetical protein